MGSKSGAGRVGMGGRSCSVAVFSRGLFPLPLLAWDPEGLPRSSRGNPVLSGSSC